MLLLIKTIIYIIIIIAMTITVRVISFKITTTIVIFKRHHGWLVGALVESTPFV